MIENVNLERSTDTVNRPKDNDSLSNHVKKPHTRESRLLQVERLFPNPSQNLQEWDMFGPFDME